MPKERKIVRLDDRLVVLVNRDFKDAYLAMCEKIEVNPSEHIRLAWETELALYESSKV